MSSPENPLSNPEQADLVNPPATTVIAPVAGTRTPIENPPWSGLDVVLLALITLIAIIFSTLAVMLVAHFFFVRDALMLDVMRKPLPILFTMLLSYMIVLAVMYIFVVRDQNRNFWDAIQWNWPDSWGRYLWIGVGLAFGLQVISHFLPIPKDMPIGKMFNTARDAFALTLFSVTMAPLFEELMFRGFLYPVLARRIGMWASIILTSAGFALLHAQQLASAWGPVLIIFLVGGTLTWIRARTRSVASSVLVHLAYNGTLGILTFILTSGYRHLERLNQ